MAVLEGVFVFINDHPSLLLIGLGIYCLIFYITLLFADGKRGKNPFYCDTRRTVQPIIRDKQLRDDVIKQGFSEKKIPENLDVIVIGSGISGLTTAALLAKVGKKVLVLEQHGKAGGCCHTFGKKGFKFDTGIHYVGEMQHRTLTRTLFEQISDGQVQWAPLDKNFDTVAIGKAGDTKNYPLISGKEELKQCILNHFPDEKKAIDKFFATLQEIRGLYPYCLMLKYLNPRLTQWILRLKLLNIFTSYVKYAEMTTQQYLDSITDNQHLKAVLSYCFGDYGTPPSESSMMMNATLFNHLSNSPSYPVGGASEIPMQVIPVIQNAGGRVLLKANVTDILIEEGQAVGVRVCKGGSKGGGKDDTPVEIRAKTIISAAGIPNTLKMLPVETAKATGLVDMLNDGTIESGVAALSLFVGLEGTTESLDLKAANLWAFTDADLNASFTNYINHEPDLNNPTEVPLLFISFPSAKDPAWPEKSQGKSVCTVITLCKWDWFKEWKNSKAKKRGDDYETFKDSFAKQIWSQVLKFYPQLENKVQYMELGSPVTNNYYIGSTAGEIYGLDHNKLRLRPDIAAKLRPNVGVPGLYLSGQDILNCGFVGGLYAGVLTASAVLNRNLVQDCMKLHKQIKKSEKSKQAASNGVERNGVQKSKSE